jgi:hypothetical protein
MLRFNWKKIKTMFVFNIQGSTFKNIFNSIYVIVDMLGDGAIRKDDFGR